MDPNQPNQGHPQQPYYPPQGQPQYPGQQPNGYPQPGYPQQPPPKKKRTGLIVGLVILGVVLLLCIGGIVAISNAAKGVATLPATTPATNSGTTGGSSSSHHKIGETVTTGDGWQITVQSTSTTTASDIATPKAGNTYLMVKVSAKNSTGKTQEFSSLLMCDVRAADGTQITESLMTGTTAPNGSVANGEKIGGTLAYEVPKSYKGYVFEFIATPGGDPTIFDL